MKPRFLMAVFAALALGFLALPALAAPGDIDTTFNGGVPAVIDLNPVGELQSYAAAMNPLNGDILWAGAYQISGNQGGTINAYKPDGTLDPGVDAVKNSPGKITLTADQVGGSFVSGTLGFYAIAVDGQGRILAAGEVYNSTGNMADMVLARFKPNGTLDTSFGSKNTGIVLSSLNTFASGSGLSLTADGHILVTGNAGDTQQELTVWRFTADGQVDSGFNGSGHVQIATVKDFLGFDCWPALQPDGALIVGCRAIAARSWTITRLTTDGTVDTAFGTNGFVTSAANRDLGGIALAPDGGFVISERDPSTSPSPLDLRRYLADGSVDTNFNGDTPLVLGPVSGTFPVAVQPDGKILVSGNDPVAGNHSLGIVRILADGSLDSNFGSNASGISDIDISNTGTSYTPHPTTLLVQGNGKIVVSGYATPIAGGNSAAFVTRVLSDTYALTPTTPAFTDVLRAPMDQAVDSNAVTVSGVSIGSANSGFAVALVTKNGKYGKYGSGGPFAGGFTGTNAAWVPAGSQLALEQMTPTTGGTASTTSVVLGGFWAANNYEAPLGSPATASWKTTTDQPPVASAGTLTAATAKATTGALTATNPSSGTLAFAIVVSPTHGKAKITNTSTGAYTYTSAGGYTGSDSFTWKVNDGVADSNLPTVSITVKATPPSSGGGGSLSALGLLALALLGFGVMFRKRRGF